MKTTITISEQEASEIIAKYFEAKSGDSGTSSVLVERVVEPTEPAQKPIFNIHTICRQINKELGAPNNNNKIACIKMLREKASDAGITISLGEAKFFVEQFL